MPRFIEHEGQQWRVSQLADHVGMRRATLASRIERFGATATGISRSLATGIMTPAQCGQLGAQRSPWGGVRF